MFAVSRKADRGILVSGGANLNTGKLINFKKVIPFFSKYRKNENWKQGDRKIEI
jgi:hypothetical protein